MAKIETTAGDLIIAPAEALVNAVNCVGVMGKGLALQFRTQFPAMFDDYARSCASGSVAPGSMHTFDRGTNYEQGRWIINFPTKRHWRDSSRMEDIEAGLIALVATVRRLGIHSVAVPALGCGLGGLEWSMVRPCIESAFASLADVRVLLYPPKQPAPAQPR